MIMRIVTVFLVGLLLAACVPQTNEQLVTSMPPTQTVSQPVVPFTIRKVEVAPFRNDQYHSPLSGMAMGNVADWMSLKDKEFAAMLTAAIAKSNMFPATGGDGQIDIAVEQVAWRDVEGNMFPPAVYEAELKYVLRLADGRQLYAKSLKGRGVDHTFFGMMRIEQANLKAYTANINAFLADIQTELPQRWAEMREDRRRKDDAAVRITANLRPLSEMGVVVVDGAIVRELPETGAPRIAAPGLNTAVSVLGELPDGWLRVSTIDGKSGWIFGTSLRREQQTAAPADRPKSAGRPGAVPASPSPLQEVANTGYIASPAPVDYLVVADVASRSAPRQTAATVKTFRKGDRVSAVVTSRNGYLMTRADGVFAGWLPLSHATPVSCVQAC